MVWQKPRMRTLKTTSYKASLTLMDNLVVKKKLDQNWVLSEMSVTSGIQPNLSAIETASQAWRCWVELIYEVYKPTVTWLILIKKYWLKNNETFTGYTNRQRGLINLQTTVKPINQMPSLTKLVCQFKHNCTFSYNLHCIEHFDNYSSTNLSFSLLKSVQEI